MSKTSNTIARIIVVTTVLIFRASARAIRSYKKSKVVAAGPVGSFAFQDNDTFPETDSEGRVVVNLEDWDEGEDDEGGFEWRVNIKGLRPEIALELAGELTSTNWFERRIKVRFRPDKNSPYDTGIWVETLEGEQIGWIWAECSQEATDAMNYLDSTICKVSPFLMPYDFTFEATAEVIGSWWTGGIEDEARIDSIEIFVAQPMVAEIY